MYDMDLAKKKCRQFFLFGPKITASRALSTFLGQRTIPDSILYIVYVIMVRERKGGRLAFMRCKSSRDQFTTLTIVLLYTLTPKHSLTYPHTHTRIHRHTHTPPGNYAWNFNCPTIWLLKTEQPLVLPPVQRPSYNSHYRSTRRIQLLFKRHLTTRSIIITQTDSFFPPPSQCFYS